MPELPEVETVLRALRPILKGKRINRIEILRPAMVRKTPLLLQEINLSPIKDITRTGKYLFFHFEHGAVMELHLRMSGRLIIRKENDPSLRHERIRFHFEDGEILVFHDVRTLGRIEMYPNGEPEVLKRLGPDAILVSEREFIERFSLSKKTTKGALLDQAMIAGVGNIYADEACFHANINPKRCCKSLSPAELSALFHAVRAVLLKGISGRGTTLSDFMDPFGKRGNNQLTLSVYGRKGQPCSTCGAKLTGTEVAGRTTVFCHTCQR